MNSGPFTSYPHLIRLLMDRSFRSERLARINLDVATDRRIGSIDREYTLMEIAVMTRAGPARVPADAANCYPVSEPTPFQWSSGLSLLGDAGPSCRMILSFAHRNDLPERQSRIDQRRASSRTMSALFNVAGPHPA